MTTLTVLGAGSILPRKGFGSSGYALEIGDEVTLLDCGPGTMRSLGEAEIDLRRIRRVVLSHFHPDHCLDLFAFAFARRNPYFEGVGALEIVGPVGLAKVLAGGQQAFGRWVEFKDTDVVEVEVDARKPVHLSLGLELHWHPTKHTPHALAWRVELPDGSSLTYTGDTGENPEVAELASGTDLLVSECSFAEEAAVEHHLTPRGAGRLAAKAGCKKLLLSHFYPGLEPEDAAREAAREYEGPIETARDRSRHRVA